MKKKKINKAVKMITKIKFDINTFEYKYKNCIYSPGYCRAIRKVCKLISSDKEMMDKLLNLINKEYGIGNKTFGFIQNFITDDCRLILDDKDYWEIVMGYAEGPEDTDEGGIYTEAIEKFVDNICSEIIETN